MNFIKDLKKLITKYILIIKAKWIGFVTEAQILLGLKLKPMVKPKVKAKAKKKKKAKK